MSELHSKKQKETLRDKIILIIDLCIEYENWWDEGKIPGEELVVSGVDSEKAANKILELLLNQNYISKTSKNKKRKVSINNSTKL